MLRECFINLPLTKPTLEEALEEAGIHNKNVLADPFRISTRALEDPEISALGFTKDEATVLSCYIL